MSDAMSDDVLAAMIARDDAAGDGASTPDYEVYSDRHLLISEVQRLRQDVQHLRATVLRLRSGRPFSG